MTNAERGVSQSTPQVEQQTEKVVMENGSIVDSILKSRGFKSLERAVSEKKTIAEVVDGETVKKRVKNERRIPLFIAKDMILVDSVKADEDTKIKLLAYRLWLPDGKFDLIKEYFPEGSIKLDNFEDLINEVMMDEGHIGNFYQRIDDLDNISKEILPYSNITRYKILINIIGGMLDDNYSPNDILSEKENILEELLRREKKSYKLRKKNYSDNSLVLEIEKLQLKRKDEDPGLKVVEDLYGKGFTVEQIENISGLTKKQIDYRISALIFDGRLKPRKSNLKRSQEFKTFVLKVEKIKNENIDYPLTVKEIANLLKTTPSKVIHATRILLLLNRIKRTNQSVLEIRVKGVRRKAREGLFEFARLNPGKGKPVIFDKIHQQIGVSVVIVSEEYQLIKDMKEAPISLQDYYKHKKEQFFKEIRRYEANKSNFNVVEAGKRIGIKSSAASQWAREYYEEELEDSNKSEDEEVKVVFTG